MALPSFCRQTVTITRAPMKEDRGVKIRDWKNAVSFDITGVSVQPASSTTDRDEARTAVSVRCVVYFPPNSDVNAYDKVSFNGTEYSFNGAPLPIESPTGAVSHIRAELVDWKG